MGKSRSKLVLGGAAIVAALGIWAASRDRAPEDSKTLVGRIWIDHLPKTNTDHFEVFIVLADDPIGIFQRRSAYEGSYTIFNYELRGDAKIQLLFPQDKTKAEVGYDARACDVKDFDYCLELKGAPRGAKKYLSRKEWELDAKDLPTLQARLEEFRKGLPAPE
jgi:hypothetical protein